MNDRMPLGPTAEQGRVLERVARFWTDAGP
jgi:hypothetical protein